jgi:CubicO group peptidase (beta-lactamase class C family)
MAHVFPSILFAISSLQAPPPDLSATLQDVAEYISARYNCSIALSYTSGNASAAAAAGFTDAGLGLGKPTRPAKPDDLYVWGSTTKMFTGAAVLRLVDAGVVDLDDPIQQHIDPFLLHANNSRLVDHFGTEIEKVTVQMLLHMTSGITDYDYAPYTEAQFADRGRDFAPLEILSDFVPKMPWLPGPGRQQRYCSTNYILLGLLLTAHAKPAGGSPWTWQSYDQRQILPTNLSFPRSLFVDAGRCSDVTAVHGFLQSYEGVPEIKPQDVYNLSCVGGWTAGNYVGPTDEVARFTRALYRPGGGVVSAASQALMTNFSTPGSSHHHHFNFYGMGTFDLSWSIGGGKTAYGHVGDTYGYQSQTTFFPDLDGAVRAVCVAPPPVWADQFHPPEPDSSGPRPPNPQCLAA